ncbi:DUF397 domain-containing protein [Saccharothrix sp. 6-C]|uniref:DUF397 domain-containing protein n=1 Tax=Saccharothrix sp. 6-C TaxID=2781735 RepID=UPI00191788D4|nr:DUF397 domain-containing protein [Saccharothrix sp. 6-C]QQQ76647.1 DUF397 domain-containing protein [Saccharothrix sp. 6-C]
MATTAPDLYSVDLAEVKFTALGCDPKTSDEACVTFAEIPGVPDALALGDSKRPDLAVLRFTSTELDTFVLAYAVRRGLTL